MFHKIQLYNKPNCPGSYVQRDKLPSLVFSETILPLVNNNDTTNWERHMVWGGDSFFCSIPGKLNWRICTWKNTWSDFEIIKWNSVHSTVWRRILLQSSNSHGFHSWLMLKFSFLCLLLSVTRISVWDIRHFYWNWGLTSNCSCAVQCTHQIQQSRMAHSPVVQTGHPVGLQCVARCQCAASQDLSPWMGADSLSVPLPVLLPDRKQALSFQKSCHHISMALSPCSSQPGTGQPQPRSHVIPWGVGRPDT